MLRLALARRAGHVYKRVVGWSARPVGHPRLGQESRSTELWKSTETAQPPADKMSPV